MTQFLKDNDPMQQPMQDSRAAALQAAMNMSAGHLTEEGLKKFGDEGALQEGKRQSMLSAHQHHKNFIAQQRKLLAWFKETHSFKRRYKQEQEQMLVQQFKEEQEEKITPKRKKQKQ